jgi:hypothetical protein
VKINNVGAPQNARCKNARMQVSFPHSNVSTLVVPIPKCTKRAPLEQ